MRILMAAIGAVAVAVAVTVVVATPTPTQAQAPDIPPDYQAVMTTLGKKGDFKDGVLKVNIPRGDLTVTIGGRAAPTPFGFGGWVALTKDTAGGEVLMGDLVLTEDEVNPVMSALLDNGLDVTALHNHFFWEQPRIFYMHVHGRGSASELATRLKPAIGLIDTAAKRSTSTALPASPSPASSAPAAGALDGAALAKTVGHQGEQTGPVYKITIGRSDLSVKEHGATINARMGLNTWAAFAGSNSDAMVAGDVAMLEHEVTPALKVLRANGINIVAIHNHMTEVQPMVVFLHYYGTGPAEQLARAVRAAVDVLGKAPTASHASHGGTPPSVAAVNSAADAAKQVLFMCPHGAAKSVLASAYFQRLAKERRLNVRVDAAGTDPDPEVGKAVAAHLMKTGYALPIDKPRKVTPRDIEQADVVVSLGCDMSGLPKARGTMLKWDDVPGPGENFAAADQAIRKHVEELVDELARATQRPHD